MFRLDVCSHRLVQLSIYHLKHIYSPCQDTCMLTSVTRINIYSNLMCLNLYIISSTKGVVELIVELVWWMTNNRGEIIGV